MSVYAEPARSHTAQERQLGRTPLRPKPISYSTCCTGRAPTTGTKFSLQLFLRVLKMILCDSLGHYGMTALRVHADARATRTLKLECRPHAPSRFNYLGWWGRATVFLFYATCRANPRGFSAPRQNQDQHMDWTHTDSRANVHKQYKKTRPTPHKLEMQFDTKPDRYLSLTV